MTNLKILLAGYNNISSIGKIDKLEELSRLDVTQNPITDTTVLEKLVENNDIYISCDMPMDKRLPGLTDQDKM
ncbi:MAG: Leucine Rich repeats (2 copies) [Firmicutes bacterium ADurb.Bin419]|nr:MAG: Leucine Rich repeats (2 copies) [Firmicutes bacterium ADurb.Bin419]